ncbi:MAG: hypothetical protein ACOZQL_07350 [Myxococcota bacterium]
MAGKRRTPWVWLVVAALLLALGAWLMRGAEPPDREPLEPVRLPTHMSRAESQRATERRTWVPLVVDAGVLAPPAPPRDPVLALMPAHVEKGAVVAEFNAILNSELGGLMTQCLFGDGEDDFLGELRDAGLDPTTKVDRVAMIDDAMAVTGDFRNAQWRQFLPKSAVSKGYGRQGELVEVPLRDGGVDTFATWGGQMFLAGDEAELKRILDRLDGSGPAVDKPVLDDSMAFGEVYGVLNAQSLARVLGQQDPQLADLIERSAKSVELHMDISHDVGLVADVNPSDAKTTEELRRALGSALSLARMKAQAEGKRDEADILDLARVKAAQGGGGFRLEAGLPYDYMAKTFRECVEQKKARRAAGEADGGN